ncbi:hypothetical protein ACWCYY_11510 [Kitasatospora sp. NPDC001664]
MVLAAACFVAGLPVGAALLYLLERRAALNDPLYLALFVLVAFASLAAVDRALHRKTGPTGR